ncbi:MAG TPA: GNAT family protein [Caulobacteraceae bacterium]|jgi:ribosomal-protein-alanine N-acetyltransferase|nr:GNAT family protein [Caulobacteraceae bacterium]
MTETPTLPPLDLPIRTERLLLRDFRFDDFEAVHAYASDPEVVKFMPWGPNTEDDTHEFLKRVVAESATEPRGEYGLAIELSAERQVVGSIALHPVDLPNGTMMTGYCLRRDLWGRGLIFEGARALLGAGFGQLGLHRIFATCDVRNTGSWRVMEKLRMRREGLLRKDRLVHGEWRDTLVYAVLAEEWGS